MRKLSYFIISIFIFLLCFNISFASNDCNLWKNEYLDLKNKYESLEKEYYSVELEITNRYKGTWATIRDIELSIARAQKEILNNFVEIENKYNFSIECLNTLFENWFNSYQKGDYENSIWYYKKYLYISWDINDVNYSKALWNLTLWYWKLIQLYSVKDDYENLLKYSLESLSYDNKNVYANMWAWYAYMRKKDYKSAKLYMKKAQDYNTDIKIIEELKVYFKEIEDNEKKDELLKNAPTNDILSWYQYYLNQLNIPNAWEKVTNNKQVIVAIIDDWININHPDLLNSIWINPKAKYGDSKIIDFVWDWMPANLPVWEHWTMIAWIIWASQNNYEGIAWISKNVKLMPLRVFDADGISYEEDIIDAINYAIDNWANIINLSLWQSQFYYSDNYDEVIKKAYDNWVIVVIAAWNWDILSWQNTWINLTNNPISPVCNNESKYKFSIWVYATDEDWYRTNWTNYWDCTWFFAPWVWIISTSIPIFNSNYWDNYNISDWTSFSAPIITWIIALWYNQYWYINPSDIYDSLEESKVKVDKIWYKIDASKYIDIIWQKFKQQEDEQKIIDNENKQKQKAELVFNQIKKQLNRKSQIQKNNYYKSILKQLNPIKDKLSWDKSIIINHLVYLLNEEIKK